MSTPMSIARHPVPEGTPVKKLEEVHSLDLRLLDSSRNIARPRGLHHSVQVALLLWRLLAP